MGKLSSFLGGRWRAGWLVLILAALLVADGAFAAKARMRDNRWNDSAWSNGGSRDSNSSRDNADAGNRNFSGTTTDKSDKANDKSAKTNKDDGDDDDGRASQPRDSGKPQGKGAGKTSADDGDPPKTMVEMLQRMFPANTPGSGGDAKSSNRTEAGKSGDSDKAPKADAARKDQDAGPVGRRGPPPLQPAQVKRAMQRASHPSLSWQREARASDLFRRDEVLVSGASPAAMAQLRFAHVETITTPTASVSRFLVPEGLDAISARQLLREQMPGVSSGFNYVYRPYVAAMEGGTAVASLGQPIRSSANGCSAERCYGPSLINWVPDSSACVIEVGVGVIDTGFDSQHPAFKDRKISWSTVLEGENPSVQPWHGTGVLALLSGHPHSSTPGLIPNATFTATNTFYADGNGQPATDTTTLIKALKLMDTYKVKVINLSLAGPQDAVLHKQIKEMSEAGVLFVAAAGNGGPFALPSYPAAYPEVIAVTAVDRNLVGYRHATRGPHIDLAAPGVEIWTALPDKKEGPQTGTSFAVPYVTAAAAAVYPKDELVYRGRPLDPKKAVLSRLTTRDLGPAGRDSIYGQGLLQAPAKCADPANATVEVSSAWSPTLQPVADQVDHSRASGLMSLTPSAEVQWPGVVQQLSFQPDK